MPSIFWIGSLSTESTTLSADDPFYVYSYYLRTNDSTRIRGYVSATGGPLAVTVSSSDAAVGQLVTGSESGASVTAEIPVNSYYTPNGATNGGVEFDPLSAGTTTVSATAPGFDATYSGASQEVTVSAPGITINDQHSYSDERVAEQ